MRKREPGTWLAAAIITVLALVISCGGGGGSAPTPSGVITLAGPVGGDGNIDATGTDARFNNPFAITTDGTNLYVADTQNHVIRQIVISTGVVTTLAGTAGVYGTTDGTGTAARFNRPSGIATDGTNLYVADTNNHSIRQIVISTGVVTTLAGLSGNSGTTDDVGANARFNYPYDITLAGDLYVVDYSNHTIRKVVISSGAVTTFAGTAGTSGSTDAVGTTASFTYPGGITTDGTNLYVADSDNHTIRQIVIGTQEVTTLAGTAGNAGTADGTGAAAEFVQPFGIATDGTNLYVADTSNCTVRQIVISSKEVTTLAGSAQVPGDADGTGIAAKLSYPNGIAVHGTDLYVADTNNSTIRKIVVSTGVVTTFAGTAGSAGTTDGTGNAARFCNPFGITTDGTNLYVANSSHHTIRQIVISTGEVTTFAGAAGLSGTTDDYGIAARFKYPSGITTDGTNLYVADSGNHTIRQIVIGTQEVTTLAGTAGTPGATDATGTAATFNNPFAITTDGTNLYVADSYNHVIRQIVISTKEVTTLAGTAGTPGAIDATGTAATFNYPSGIATDGTNLYVADSYNHTIRQVVISTGVVTTLAGTAGTPGATDATGTAAEFRYPWGITTDGANLYVADSNNHTIRQIVIGTQVVTTLAGTAGKFGTVDGSRAEAVFANPAGITASATGLPLYVTSYSNHNIRKIY